MMALSCAYAIPAPLSAISFNPHRRASALGTSNFVKGPRAPVERRCRVAVQKRLAAVVLSASVSQAHLEAVRLKNDDETKTSFAESVRGEWSGFEAEIDPATGAPVVIPNYYIPEEFVEWNMEPLGFECVDSVILRESALYHKHFRILPTVSHFGDHVDVEENLEVFKVDTEEGFLAFADGSFSCGPSQVVAKRESMLDKWPRATLVIRRKREFAKAEFTFDFEKAEIREGLRVTIGKYSCVYCDGGDIDGSSGFIEGWPSENASDPEELAGKWKYRDTDQVYDTEAARPLTPNKQLYLPRGVDVGISELPEGGIQVHLGWLHDGSERVVMTRTYTADGQIASCTRTVATKC